MKLSEFNLAEMLVFKPDEGRLLLGQDRLLLFRQEAFAFLRSLLFEQLGERLGRAMLMQFGYRCGFGDFEALSKSFDWDTEEDQLGCGPVMHAWEGIVHVEPLQMEFDRDAGHFLFRGKWRNSYEAEIHVEHLGRSDHAICYSLTGYASGWCTAFFGKPVLAVETACAGKGDPACEWEIRPIDEWDDRGDVGRDALKATSVSVAVDLERTVRDRTAELLGALDQLEERNRSLSELDRMKSEFLANVSHELRTPLTLVLGPLDAILSAENDEFPARTLENLRRMRRNGHRLHGLVNGLLDFSKLEAGEMRANRQPIDLAELVRSAVDDARPYAEVSGLQLGYSGPANLPPMAFDPKMVERILANLIGNALKFTPEGGRVDVDLVEEASTARLSVTDTGPGIPVEEHEKIFERFHQVDASTTRRGEGTGLGLALVKEFADLLGGEVRVDSRVGQGSRFDVLLPILDVSTQASSIVDGASGSQAKAKMVAAAPSSVEPSEPRHDSRDLPRVLVAEDNADMRAFLREILENEYDVETVAHGREALEAGRRDRPAVLLSDIMMPEMDGLELVSQWSQDPALRMVPIILLTARGGSDETSRGLAQGAHDYLEKPFRAQDLLARVGSARRLFSLHLELEREIARHERTSAELRQAKTAIEQTAESVFITDTSGVIEYVNSAFEKMNGYRQEDVLGRKPSILKSGEQDAEFYDELWSTIKRGDPWAGRITNRRKDGRTYEAEMTISPIKQADGAVVSYVAVQRDVTEELAMEARLRHSQKMEAVGQLAGGVAHDFNNILTVILGTVQMLADKATASLQEDIGLIHDSAKQAATLTRQLLLFSRKEISEFKLVDPVRILTDMASMLRQAAREDIQLRLEIEPNVHAILADLGQIQQLIMNLVVNARDAMPRGGELVIELANHTLDDQFRTLRADASPRPCVMLSVRDTGEGMDETIRERIFEPFFTTKPTGQGCGMGLATVHGIVNRAGGHIVVTSRPGMGATFQVFFPAVEGEAVKASSNHRSTEKTGRDSGPGPEPTGRPAGRTQHSKGSTGSAGCETVMICEDDEDLRRLARQALIRDEYTVLDAGDGERALALVESHDGPIHLLVTDVIMPGMNGKQLADAMTASRPDTKILFISGYTANVIDQHGVLEEGVEFLAKPFDSSDLRRRVREVLDRR